MQGRMTNEPELKWKRKEFCLILDIQQGDLWKWANVKLETLFVQQKL